MFSRSSRASSSSLKYKQLILLRSPNLGTGPPGPEVIWTIARKHLGRIESSSIPLHPFSLSLSLSLLFLTERYPPQMSRNCDKEVANHLRNTRTLLFRSFNPPKLTSTMISFVLTRQNGRLSVLRLTVLPIFSVKRFQSFLPCLINRKWNENVTQIFINVSSNQYHSCNSFISPKVPDC